MKKTILLILFVVWSAVGFAQLTAFRKQVDNSYNFWLYTPTGYADASQKCPVVVFLHGQSLCGRDLNRVRRYGSINAVERGMKIDAMILAPQNPGGAWNPKKVKNILDWVQANYPVDTTRIYVVGMSLGGFGTMDFAGTYPQTVAAAAAFCGGCTLKSVAGLAEVPLWIMHGTADRDVSIVQSERVADEIRKEGGGLLRFDRIKGFDHGDLARVFYLPELYEWLFRHSTADSLRQVDTSVVITASTFKQAYKSIERDAPKVQVVDAGDNAAKSVAAANDEADNKSNGKSVVHIVKQGDTLGAIARKYGTSVSKLCRANGIKSTSILGLGQRITVE